MIAYVVTFSMKTVIVLARNERQVEAYTKLRFGKQMFFVIAPATEHQVNYITRHGSVYMACLTGGKK